MNDKIENNPSFRKMRGEIEGFKALLPLIEVFEAAGLTDRNIDIKTLSQEVTRMEEQLKAVSTTPDTFNTLFSDRGWIAYDTMNSELMDCCIAIAKNDRIEAAEQKLIDYYSSDSMRWLITMLKGNEVFRLRAEMIEIAYQDTIDKRYYSSIPLILMVIDGGVNDVDRSKGFFAENVDLTAWDSIAAHSSGLAKLKDIFNDTRKKTTTEPITMPYRHGILHGRDLGYANQIVAAKCWAALFAINDWTKAVAAGKRNPPHEEPKKTTEESIQGLSKTLEDYHNSSKQNEEVSRLCDQWSPRVIRLGIDIPDAGRSDQYDDYLPEKEAIRFLEYWMQRNYGAIAQQIYHSGNSNHRRKAGEIRRQLENSMLKRYSIISIRDEAPAISEIFIHITFSKENIDYDKNVKLRFICDGENGQLAVIGQPNARWRFIENFLQEIENPEY